MSIFRQLHTKSLNTQSTRKVLASRFFAAAAQNFTADEPFPDEPTSAYYDEQVNKAGRNGDLETVGYLLNKRYRDGCFNTVNTFKFLTDNESSLALIDPLIQTLSRLDKGYTRKQAFDLLIARLCKLERTDEALRVIDTMAKEGFGVNAACFQPVLNTLTRKKKMEEAWRVLDLMRHAGVSPDVTAYNYLLKVFCFEGNLTQAVAVVKKIEAEGLVADGRTFDALILGASKAGKLAGAMVLVRRMMDGGLHVQYSTIANVINGMLRLGYFDQAVRFVMAFKGRDRKLDEESLGMLASKLINLNKKDEAMVLLNEMSKMRLIMGTKLFEFYKSNA
ncbi:hypothetical protein CCACVL1_30661 [Corchorus capsularis]|uniref:Pentatricopeptide repeat-containing protein-mitochondrial domain-containing protein n=1 Tax=Corchorus capsularis TaxID=210143 RepID=A0A1R3FW51_COCAP|nr:hypothetical protein CCACVL1_30661 [Corchorus capsularis]